MANIFGEALKDLREKHSNRRHDLLFRHFNVVIIPSMMAKRGAFLKVVVIDAILQVENNFALEYWVRAFNGKIGFMEHGKEPLGLVAMG